MSTMKNIKIDNENATVVNNIPTKDEIDDIVEDINKSIEGKMGQLGEVETAINNINSILNESICKYNDAFENIKENFVTIQDYINISYEKLNNHQDDIDRHDKAISYCLDRLNKNDNEFSKINNKIKELSDKLNRNRKALAAMLIIQIITIIVIALSIIH